MDDVLNVNWWAGLILSDKFRLSPLCLKVSGLHEVTGVSDADPRIFPKKRKLKILKSKGKKHKLELSSS